MEFIHIAGKYLYILPVHAYRRWIYIYIYIYIDKMFMWISAPYYSLFQWCPLLGVLASGGWQVVSIMSYESPYATGTQLT